MKELLELAAKAAGIEFDERFACFYDGHQKAWNPLTDDDDALRLAVKLRLVIDWSDTERATWIYKDAHQGIVEEHNGDPYAATRRAIVRAAAEIGRSL